MLEEAGRYRSDDNPILFLHSPCEPLTHAPAPTPPTDPGARIRYDVQRAEADQLAQAFELQQHFIPLIQHDVDLLAGSICSMFDICSQ